MAIEIKVGGIEQFGRLSRDLKRQGRGDLQKQLRNQVRDAGRPVVSDLRAAVRGVQVSSPGGGHQRPDRSTGLRDRVAAATGLSVTQRGVRIKVNEHKVGPYGASLPRYLDASLRRNQRWRHPVFGNRNVWASQQGQPWFFVTMRRHRRDFRAAVLDAMERTVQELS